MKPSRSCWMPRNMYVFVKSFVSESEMRPRFGPSSSARPGPGASNAAPTATTPTTRHILLSFLIPSPLLPRPGDHSAHAEPHRDGAPLQIARVLCKGAPDAVRYVEWPP